MSESLEKKYRSSPLFGSNAPYIEEFYEDFLDDPQSVPGEWRKYFQTLTVGAAGNGQSVQAGDAAVDRAHGPICRSSCTLPRHELAQLCGPN